MHPKDSPAQNNVWFGVAMFLIGLIAGSVLTFASGNLPVRTDKTGGSAPSQAPQIPQAPQAPQAPKAETLVRMVGYAKDLGINESDFKTCVSNNKYVTKINQQTTEGKAAGVNGTPGNIIYDIKSNKGILVSGAQPVSNFQTVIDAMLKDPATAIAQPGIELAKSVTPVDLRSDHIRGQKSATIAIIEYSDYQCPYCHSVHPTYQQLMKQYDGKIMWVFRHYPLAFHPEAMPLATGAECANELGGADAFWKFTDKVMTE